MSSIPIENSYRVTNHLLAGEYPGHFDPDTAAARLEAFRDAGVTVFVDLTTENDCLAPYEHLAPFAVHERHPIPDMSVPQSSGQMRGILDSIDAHTAAGETVYVHCWGGVGRTGTVVGCYLVRHGLPGEQALVRLAELFSRMPKSSGRESPETPAQREFVLAWPV